MKKTLAVTILTLAIAISVGYSQTKTSPIAQANMPVKNNDVVFQLYPTQNIYTYLKLDTRNGKMWQIQFNTDDEKRFETYLNITALVSTEREKNGRFALYATQNIYTFILLDQVEGKTWQVQWSLEPKNRMVLPIE